MWDKSLIVVAADHGVAFPQVRERRRLTRKDAAEIAPVPLLIKAPGQKRAKTERRLGLDDRHPADDLRRAEPQSEGPSMDGSLGVLGRGAAAPDAEDPAAKQLRGAGHPGGSTSSASAQPDHRPQPRPVRQPAVDGPGRISRGRPAPGAAGASRPSEAGLQLLDVDFAYGADYKNVLPSSPLVPCPRGGTRCPGGGDGGRDIAVAVDE